MRAIPFSTPLHAPVHYVVVITALWLFGGATLLPSKAAQAQPLAVDIRVELGFPNEPPYETCKLLEATNRIVGPGPELTIADEIPLAGCEGAVGVDIDETNNTITLFVDDEGATFNINYEELRVFITFNRDISQVSLISQDLFDVAASSPDPAPVISVAGNSVTMIWTAPSPSPIFGDEFLLADAGTAVLEFNLVPLACDILTATDFESPMGKKKKRGSTLPVKFQLFFDGVEITSQEDLDDLLVANGCNASCPEIAIFDVTDIANELEIDLPEDVWKSACKRAALGRAKRKRLVCFSRVAVLDSGTRGSLPSSG